MLTISDHYDLILASQSPRRKELLSGLDIPFKVQVIDVDESYPTDICGHDIPIYLAKKKAAAYSETMNENTLLITADTIVWHEGKVFNKPKNREQAFEMLQELSGNTHEVITGVCITSRSKQKSFYDITEVKFASLSENEINFYLDFYKPYDKAGAYGVQEWIGYIAVNHIVGSYFNVMGLPIHKVYEELKNW